MDKRGFYDQNGNPLGNVSYDQALDRAPGLIIFFDPRFKPTEKIVIEVPDAISNFLGFIIEGESEGINRYNILNYISIADYYDSKYGKKATTKWLRRNSLPDGLYIFLFKSYECIFSSTECDLFINDLDYFKRIIDSVLLCISSDEVISIAHSIRSVGIIMTQNDETFNPELYTEFPLRAILKRHGVPMLEHFIYNSTMAEIRTFSELLPWLRDRNILQTLSELTGLPEEFFLILPKNVCLSGGILVRALQREIQPLPSYVDIDLWYMNGPLSQGEWKFQDVCASILEYVPDAIYQVRGSIANFVHPDHPRIQLINSPFEYVENVINHFDLDYVKFAYCDSTFYFNSQAVAALHTGKTKLTKTQPLKNARIMKATTLGYKISGVTDKMIEEASKSYEWFKARNPDPITPSTVEDLGTVQLYHLTRYPGSEMTPGKPWLTGDLPDLNLKTTHGYSQFITPLYFRTPMLYLPKFSEQGQDPVNDVTVLLEFNVQWSIERLLRDDGHNKHEVRLLADWLNKIQRHLAKEHDITNFGDGMTNKNLYHIGEESELTAYNYHFSTEQPEEYAEQKNFENMIACYIPNLTEFINGRDKTVFPTAPLTKVRQGCIADVFLDGIYLNDNNATIKYRVLRMELHDLPRD